MRVDLHVHAKERSGCATAYEDEMIQAAINHGLDGLAFTDHDRLVAPERLRQLAAKYAPFSVFGGIEVGVSGEHMLVLGLQDTRLETGDWNYPALHTFVNERGGCLIFAHPFRYRDHVQIAVDRFPPHALELRSTNIRAEDEGRIRSLAERLGVPLLCNSDAHRPEDVGRHHTRLAEVPDGGPALAGLLRTGGFCCGNGAPP